MNIEKRKENKLTIGAGLRVGGDQVVGLSVIIRKGELALETPEAFHYHRLQQSKQAQTSKETRR